MLAPVPPLSHPRKTDLQTYPSQASAHTSNLVLEKQPQPSRHNGLGPPPFLCLPVIFGEGGGVSLDHQLKKKKKLSGNLMISAQNICWTRERMRRPTAWVTIKKKTRNQKPVQKQITLLRKKLQFLTKKTIFEALNSSIVMSKVKWQQ